MKSRSFRTGLFWASGYVVGSALLLYYVAFKGGDACNPGFGVILLPVLGITGFVFTILSIRFFKYPFYKGVACILCPLLLAFLIFLACNPG
jgi:glycerol-3-phosphate acyltransferase PlsY